MAFTPATRDVAIQARTFVLTGNSAVRTYADELLSDNMDEYALLRNRVAQMVGQKNWNDYFEGDFGPEPV